MRKLFVLFALQLWLVWQANAQQMPRDPVSGLITYSEVVAVGGASKQALVNRAAQWFARTYKSARVSWQTFDRESGVLIAKVNLSTEVTYFVGKVNGGMVYYTLQISCKDGKYRYTFTDFYHDGKDTDNRTGGPLEKERTKQNYLEMPVHWAEIKEQTDASILALISDLKKYMESKEGDW